MAVLARSEIFGLAEGEVYWNGLLWVPDDKDLRSQILKPEHDMKVAGYMGQDKMIELVRHNIWWPKMDERIIDFVHSCVECQRNKAECHQPYGLLSPLELATEHGNPLPWTSLPTYHYRKGVTSCGLSSTDSPR